MKFKYILNESKTHRHALNEGLLHWIKSRWREPEDYYKAAKFVLNRNGYLPMWREKWLNKITGDGEGVRYGNMQGETIRVQYVDMGGDITAITSIAYSKNGSMGIDDPDYICVFERPVEFNEAFNEIEKPLESGKTGEYTLSSGVNCTIERGVADKFNSFDDVHEKLKFYLNKNRGVFSTSGVELRRAVEEFYSAEGFSFGGNSLSWKDKLAIDIASLFGGDLSTRWVTCYAEILREDSLGPMDANKIANVMSKGWRD